MSKKREAAKATPKPSARPAGATRKVVSRGGRRAEVNAGPRGETR